MAKMKVHELAKELNMQSKEIIAFLQDKGIEVKAAQSSVEDDAVNMVKKAFGQQTSKADDVSAKESAPAAEKPVATAEKAETVKEEKPRLKRKKKRDSNPELIKITYLFALFKQFLNLI